MKTWLLVLIISISVIVSYLAGHTSSSHESAGRFHAEEERLSALLYGKPNRMNVTETIMHMENWGYSHFENYPIAGGSSAYIFSRESHLTLMQGEYFQVFIVFDSEGRLQVSSLAVEARIMAL